MQLSKFLWHLNQGVLLGMGTSMVFHLPILCCNCDRSASLRDTLLEISLCAVVSPDATYITREDCDKILIDTIYRAGGVLDVGDARWLVLPTLRSNAMTSENNMREEMRKGCLEEQWRWESTDLTGELVHVPHMVSQTRPP